MKEIRTTFYELRSYFVPGSVMLWALIELLALTGYRSSTAGMDSLSPVVKAILFIIISYVFGHALHAIANFSIDKFPFASYPPKNYFKSQFQKDFSPQTIDALFNKCVSVLGIQNTTSLNTADTIKSSYWVCFQFVMNAQNIETENFLGLTGFYRGIASAMIATFVMYLIAYLKTCRNDIGIAAILALFLFLLFLTRVRRFGNYLAKTVYSNFLHIYK